MLRPFATITAVLALIACGEPTATYSPPSPPTPHTSTASPSAPIVVLLVTPKMIADFANPDSSVAKFFANYNSLTSKASQTIVIFAVGNGDHMLVYRGPSFLEDTVTWARFTDGIAVSNRILTYLQVESIVSSFKTHAAALGISLKVYDHMDSGNEFSENTFRYGRHAECMDSTWASYDIRGSLHADRFSYATAPTGIAAGTLCGTFLADQVSAYLHDLGFDGVLYGNQLGTRGRWLPTNGPGYTDAEALAIQNFMQYSKADLGADDLMWFDSYNDVAIEHSTFSFPGTAYQYFNYLIAAGF